ncbi:DUF4179 domain-containing protein [Paenibacillus agilis]|uniref:DUF4179 domain-containing protein n=1 Tax=Paenibacillus agilis TaxID=3020863 RepID=A0A559J172_9BACL|nr:DUF4179 domain-containing protein [Paenibacillus agilis]TVX93632.1 DUF4179 domain-containing protein [Paenibacillus agilis]
MERWSNQDELAETQMKHVERLIRETQMPVSTYSHGIMKKIGERRGRKKTNIWKKALIGTTVAAVVGGILLGSGFVSPVMAEALKHIPLIGSVFQNHNDAGLKRAVEKNLVAPLQQSVTHDGVTLAAKEMIYDGSRLSLVLERSGEGFTETFLGEFDADGRTFGAGKGVLDHIRFKVNGEERFMSLTSLHPVNEHTIIVKFNDARPVLSPGAVKGMDTTIKRFPDQFDLTIEATLTEIMTPFSMTVPVKKNTENIVLKPSMKSTYSNFSLSLEQVELTPITTRMQLVGKGEIEALPEIYIAPKGDYYEGKLNLGADIVDEHGNSLKGLSYHGMGGGINFYEGIYYLDFMYNPFSEKPEQITIKPYLYEAITLTNHTVTKKYIPELEFIVPVPK